MCRYRSGPGKTRIRALREAERAAVEHSAYEMGANALSWLSCTSFNPGVQSVVIEAVSALPLNSVAILKHRAKRISEPVYHTLICGMRYHPEERKLDCLIRTRLRLTANDDFFMLSPRPQVERERLLPDGYADLLSIQSSLIYHQEIRNLVKAQLTSPIDEGLRLQPIVWGNLLRKLQLFPEEDNLTQWLFAFLLTRGNAHSALALLRSDDPAWPECLIQLDTFPAHSEIQSFTMDSSPPISDFRAFVDGGSVGVYGFTDKATRLRWELPSRRFAIGNQVMAESALAKLWPRRGTNKGDARCSGDGQVRNSFRVLDVLRRCRIIYLSIYLFK
ncbi:hypothetical protein ARMSODRAFT_501491 [Armillaria solidipes]|uniref:Uncharacterized protein n=1 Tax=Armillaria solidipes TaxID=1076256 RepID=A0A2H3C155_9AGAR|nr:hypothetical protein ARMSODRAFT_501491 [Armillaria solidipes]